MREKLSGCALTFLLILLIPCVITLLVGHEVSLPVSGTVEDGYQQIRLEGSDRRIDLQEYLIGVTAAQLPSDFALEAIKAQMILNRTYYYSILDGRDSLSGSELRLNYWSEAERKANWYETGQTDEIEDRFLKAAEETEGMVMTCQRELAVGMYHRASAGMTRDLSSKYPYLHSVESKSDLSAAEYLKVIEYSKSALISRLEPLCGGELTGELLRTGLQILDKDSAGYVETLLVGTGICTGEQFAAALGLPSPAFTLQWLDDDALQVSCRGQGHGYGMSQHGADCLAHEGKTAAEILKYYFKNVTVEIREKSE